MNCGTHYNRSIIYVKCCVVISCNHKRIYEIQTPSLSEYINSFTSGIEGKEKREGEREGGGTCNDIAKHSACMILQALTL